MTEYNINASGYVLVEAKEELTNYLKDCLTNPIYDTFQRMYEQTLKTKNRDILIEFQAFLRDVPKWNQDIIDREYGLIITKSGCDWLENLIKAVFVSTARILAVMRTHSSSRPIPITVPNERKFIHKCFILAAKSIYYNPYLFDHKLAPIKRQKNRNRIEGLIRDAIDSAVRQLLQFKSILQDSFETDEQYAKEHADELRHLVEHGLSSRDRDDDRDRHRDDDRDRDRHRDDDRDRDRDDRDRESSRDSSHSGGSQHEESTSSSSTHESETRSPKVETVTDALTVSDLSKTPVTEPIGESVTIQDIQALADSTIRDLDQKVAATPQMPPLPSSPAKAGTPFPSPRPISTPIPISQRLFRCREVVYPLLPN